MPLTKVWSLQLTSRGSFAAGLTASVTPPSAISIMPAAGTKPEGLAMSLVAKNPSPIVVLGQAGGSRFQAESITFSTGIDVTPGSGALSAQPGVKLQIGGGKAVIDTGGADSFIGKILSGLKLETNCDVDLDFSLDRGLRFGTSSGLETQLAAHVDLGPVAVNAVTLRVGIEDGRFPIGVTADLTTTLGPFDAVVQGLGFELILGIAANNDGNAGLLDIQTRFKPPNGVGLSMDAGGFKGGGFLTLRRGSAANTPARSSSISGPVLGQGHRHHQHEDAGRLAGLLAADPDHRGVHADPAELRLHAQRRRRTLRPEPHDLRATRWPTASAPTRSRASCFPQDVIANITRIISDIKQFFPPQEDHFVVGPMAKLGWGTPSIITVGARPAARSAATRCSPSSACCKRGAARRKTRPSCACR